MSADRSKDSLVGLLHLGERFGEDSPALVTVATVACQISVLGRDIR